MSIGLTGATVEEHIFVLDKFDYGMSRPDLCLPNFFIAGAPKAGTTSLYHYLDQHPQIYLSPIKEPAYFSLELRLENFGAEMQELTRRDMPASRRLLTAA